MKALATTSLSLVLFASAFACAHSAAASGGGAVIAEAKDVRPLDVRDAGASPNDVLYISGVASRDDLVVTSVRAMPDGDSLNVLVGLGTPSSGGSGRFQYTLEVKSGVRTVTFGSEKTVIWTRRQ
jgi:hypothetical protein